MHTYIYTHTHTHSHTFQYIHILADVSSHVNTTEPSSSFSPSNHNGMDSATSTGSSRHKNNYYNNNNNNNNNNGNQKWFEGDALVLKEQEMCQWREEDKHYAWKELFWTCAVSANTDTDCINIETSGTLIAQHSLMELEALPAASTRDGREVGMRDMDKDKNRGNKDKENKEKRGGGRSRGRGADNAYRSQRRRAEQKTKDLRQQAFQVSIRVCLLYLCFCDF